MPQELADLTWAEQPLISLYRVTIHVLYFRNEDLPGQRDSQQAPKKTKTHSFCVPQDTIGTNQLLPPPPTALPENHAGQAFASWLLVLGYYCFTGGFPGV